MHVFSMILATALGGASPFDDPPGAGWPGACPPAPPNYALFFESPVVAKGDAPAAYRQTARYDWIGDDYRTGVVTMARDPEFKTKYSAEAMKKEGAQETMVGKKTAWLRRAKGEGDRPTCELVVPLSDDKALIVEGQGHFFEEDVKKLAASFDLAKVEAALAGPPRTEKKKDE